MIDRVAVNGSEGPGQLGQKVGFFLRDTQRKELFACCFQPDNFIILFVQNLAEVSFEIRQGFFVLLGRQGKSTHVEPVVLFRELDFVACEQHIGPPVISSADQRPRVQVFRFFRRHLNS